MKRDGNTLSDVIRNAWDSRERLETLVKHSPTKATDATVSIVAHITTNELRAKLDETAIANGFANRFLFACVRRSKELPFGGTPEPAKMQTLGERLRAAFIAAQITIPITMDAAAQKLWRAIYSELSKGGDDLFAFITARAEAQTVRLALVYALLDQAAVIGLPHLEAALALWRYSEASVRFVFGDMLGDPTADTILETLRRRKPAGMSRTDIRDLFSRNLPTTVISVALGLLERKGKVRCEQQQSGGPRPREMWFAA